MNLELMGKILAIITLTLEQLVFNQLPPRNCNFWHFRTCTLIFIMLANISHPRRFSVTHFDDGSWWKQISGLIMRVSLKTPLSIERPMNWKKYKAELGKRPALISLKRIYISKRRCAGNRRLGPILLFVFCQYRNVLRAHVLLFSRGFITQLFFFLDGLNISRTPPSLIKRERVNARRPPRIPTIRRAFRICHLLEKSWEGLKRLEEKIATQLPRVLMKLKITKRPEAKTVTKVLTENRPHLQVSWFKSKKISATNIMANFNY